MREFKVETFDAASRLANFINEIEQSKTKDIEIVEIVGRRIADICTVYDLFYWEKTKPKRGRK